MEQYTETSAQTGHNINGVRFCYDTCTCMYAYVPVNTYIRSMQYI